MSLKIGKELMVCVRRAISLHEQPCLKVLDKKKNEKGLCQFIQKNNIKVEGRLERRSYITDVRIFNDIRISKYMYNICM